MTDIELLQQIAFLPKNLKKEVANFVTFLKQKSNAQKHIKEGKFGYVKDFFKMSDDFDELLEDFTKYAMKLLPDTHAFIWFINGDKRLPLT